MKPIGILKTCFQEKFGVPRQPRMVREAWGILKLNDDPAFGPALEHLDGFSHIWLIFLFHQNGGTWRATIDPPRLEAPAKVGVFASRSPHRPNPLGLSAVRLERIDREAPGGIEIHLSGVDILDGTPVLDIKPYLPYADSIPDARPGWLDGEIPRFPVEFAPESLRGLEAEPSLKRLIEQMLEWDPRPTSQRRAAPLGALQSEGKRFAFRVLSFDVHWRVQNGAPYVTGIHAIGL